MTVEKEIHQEHQVRGVRLSPATATAQSVGEGLLQSLMEAMPNPVFYKDREGIYRGCNEAFASDVLGLPSARIIGSNVYDLAALISPEWADIDLPKDLALLLEPGTETYKMSVRYADGAFHDVVIHKTSLMGPDGAVGGVASAVVDVTEARKMEEKSTMLLELTQAAIAETDVLYQLSSSLIAFEDLGSLLQAVVNGVADMLLADRVLLATVDLEQRRVIHYVKGGVGAGNVALDVTFDELWNGLSGWVMRELEPALSPKGVPDPRESPDIQRRRQEESVGAIVVVPLCYQNRTLGTLTAVNRLVDADFTQKDVSLMMAMANQLASAIQNVRLLERVQTSLAETEGLYQAARTIGGAQSIAEILDALFDAVTFMPPHEASISVILEQDAQRRPSRMDVYTATPGEGRSQVRVESDGAVGTVDRLLADPHQLLVYRNPDDPRSAMPEAMRTRMTQSGHRTLLMTGLSARGQHLGFLTVASAEDLDDSSDHSITTIVRALADQVGVVLDNILLGEQTRQRAGQLETLSVIESALSETNTEAEMLDVFVLALSDTTFLKAWLVQLDVTADGEKLSRIMTVWYDGEVQPYDPLINQSVTTGILPLAPLWESGLEQPLYFRDLQTDPEVDDSLRERAATQGLRSAMVLPLFSGGRTQGVVVLTWPVVYDLTSTEQFLVRRLVRPTAALLARRRAYLAEEMARAENERRASQFQTAATVAHAASSIIGLDELLPQAVALAKERFDLYYVGVFLVDGSRRRAVLRAGTGIAGQKMLESGYGFDVDEDSIIGRCVLQATPQFSETAVAVVRNVNSLLPDTTAEMALPLVYRNQVIGAMSVQSSQVMSFSESDIIILQTVADQLANAIQNARLFDQLNISLTESEMQTEVSLAISEAQSVEDMIKAAMQVSEFVDMTSASLRLFTRWDVQNQPLTQDLYGMVVGDDTPSLQDKKAPFDRTLFDWFLSDPRRIFVYKDLADPDVEIPETVRSNMLKRGYHSMIVAPLSARDRALGLLMLYGTSPMRDQADRYTQTFVRTLIDQMATGLDRYMLLNESERRIRRMATASDVARYAASILDQETLLTETVALIRERFDLYYVGIFLVDDSRQWAVLRAGTGEAGQNMLAQGHRLAVGGASMIGTCVATAAPRIALDVGAEAQRFENPYLPNTHSEMALPLISRTVVIGAMTIQSEEVAAFSREDITILQTMADQLATAIGNAQLFAQSQASLEELERLQRRYALDMWENYVEQQRALGYAYDLNEVSPVLFEEADVSADTWSGQIVTRYGTEGGDGGRLVAPLELHNQPVGYLSFEEPATAIEWSEDNVAVIEAVREQLSLALENRLLIDQSQNALSEARQREQEVRFLQEVAAFLNATENIIMSQDELLVRLRAFIPVDSVSIAGYDVQRTLRFLGMQTGHPLRNEAWIDTELGEDTGYVRVVGQGDPWTSSDIRLNSQFWEDQSLVAAGIVSRAVLPLRLGVRILGTLNLESKQGGAFSRPELMPILSQIAAQVASAMERATLLRRAQESAGESRTLYEATSALAEATSFEMILRAVVGHTILDESARAEIGMFVVNPATGEEFELLEIVSAWSSDPKTAAMQVGQRVTVSAFPALQWVAPGGQLYICEDLAMARDLDAAARDLYLQQGVRALIVARLSTVGAGSAGDIGLLQIRFSAPYHPTEQDVRLYNSIVDQTAVVLSNQKLLRLSEARTEQLTSAVDFANLATALAEREDLLRQSVDFFKMRFGFHYVSLYMLDEVGEWAVLQAGTGDVGEQLLRMGQRTRVDDSSMVGWCVVNDRPRIAQDVTHDALYFRNPLLPDVQSSITLPLKSRGQVNGALSIESVQRFAFTGEVVSTLELMATQLANMIESAELYDRSQNSLAETRMLYRIAQQITDALTVEEVFKAAVEGLSQRPEPDWIVAAQLEPRQDPTRLRIVWAWSRDGAAIPVESYPLDKAPRFYNLLRDDESFVTKDVTQDPLVDDYFRALFGQVGLRAMAAFQLRVYGVQYGTIMVHSRKAREFSNTELRFYENVSRQAFVALQNINLVAETREQAERRDILNEVLRTASSSLDRLSLLRDVGRVLATRLQRPVVMWNWDGSMVSPVSVHATGGALLAGTNDDLYFSRREVPVVYQAIDGMMPVRVDFTSARERLSAGILTHFDPALVAGYAVPLRVRGTVFGVMLVGQQEGQTPLGDEMTDFIRTAGVNVSVALQTAVLYQEAQETAEKLQEVDKLKNQFMANMSHELRTPLNSIIGFSRVILKGIDGPLTNMQATDLTAIYESGKNLLDLINDILDISKIDAGKMEMIFEPTDIPEIVQNVMTTIAEPLKDTAVKLIADLPEGLPTVLADGRRIRQVLTNIVGNATKFTEHGYIKISATYDAYEVAVSVEDTGVGIPEDRKHAVFEKFEQVDSSSTRRYGGTGLGLPLSREFIRLHGGDMGFESVAGEGSRFFFSLPIGGPTAKRPDEVVEEERPGMRTILAVDDDEGVITLFQRYLEKRGYKVAGMTTGEGVVETVKRLKPYAITLDVIMPGKDGWQIIQELKSDPETRDTPIIVCSIMSDADKGLSMGIADYLMKPVTEQDLLGALVHLERPEDHGHILVVDDNPDDRKLLHRILSNAGYQVQEAEGGAEAIQSIHVDPPSLVVLDLMMPDIDGFAVLENLKMNRATRDIPVVVVTAKDLGEQERDRLQQRVEALLQKGLFDQGQLLNDVVSALDRLAPQDSSRVGEPPRA